MKSSIKIIENGSISSPKGFKSGAIFAGIKTPGEDKKDIGILFSDEPCTVAGTYSQNSILSPSVTLTKERVNSKRKIRGLVANSGCANCSVGEQGYLDAKETTNITAKFLNVDEEEILVASTGIIGIELPMALMREYIPKISISNDYGKEFAKSILTTDKKTKEIALVIELGDQRVNLAGVAKGSGMIHPNMATMLAFITTDAKIEKELLQKILSEAIKKSFNQTDVDGDQSTNDTVLIFANGKSGVNIDHKDISNVFSEAVTKICQYLAKEIAKDGEGASKLIEVTVEGAKSDNDALLASRSVASSLLVRTAVYGRDPNWGRILMAVGKTGIDLEESKIDLYINEIQIASEGKAIAYNVQSVITALGKEEVSIKVSLNIGSGYGQAWGSDLTEEYVIFNSAYTT
ncbi:MAG: bifunctional ornithine acetyltransferase/N-acetylglutamate synthase [Chloroflexi bacterium]|nr:bifunctional ornithine acetyltransferase/N-acetylglutamate synthase [Chloroflexota bacterium]|tara:strand:- start:57392 stop:58606 length:1215 start_codon:yes stop_codon:yes gene_type:complete